MDQKEALTMAISELKDEARQHLFSAIDILKLATKKYTENVSNDDLLWSHNLEKVAGIVAEINWKAYEIDEVFAYGKESHE